MNSFYNVLSSEVSRINLVRIDENNFRILEFDVFTPLLTGADYTLIDNSLLPAFKQLGKDEIEIKHVLIIRKATGQEWDNYCELIIHEHIDPGKIEMIDSNEKSVWQYNHHLFVSHDLMKRLKKLSKDDLIFSVGFSHFA